MIDYGLLEHVVANWLWSAAEGHPGRAAQRSVARLSSCAVKVANAFSSNSRRAAIRERPGTSGSEAPRYPIQRPAFSSSHQTSLTRGRSRDSRTVDQVPGKAQWMALKDLPTALGKPSPGSWASPQTWSTLQQQRADQGIQTTSRTVRSRLRMLRSRLH